MDPATNLEARRDEVIAEYGPWVAFNIDLGHGVHTIRAGEVGTPEFMVHAFTQIITDLAAKPLDQLRVLDLACHEGGYALELARHGATVVGIEGRRENVEKARFAADALRLDRATFIEDDVRNLALSIHGRFDVVLCLGIHYHLEGHDAIRLLERCFECCDHLAIIRTAIGLSVNADTKVGLHTYREPTRGGARQQGQHPSEPGITA
jgi:2-polyprenyl-3-methyl-5-hydroxy-6-metoxy-1,4-benzoquinol methylase